MGSTTRRVCGRYSSQKWYASRLYSPWSVQSLVSRQPSVVTRAISRDSAREKLANARASPAVTPALSGSVCSSRSLSFSATPRAQLSVRGTPFRESRSVGTLVLLPPSALITTEPRSCAARAAPLNGSAWTTASLVSLIITYRYSAACCSR